MKTILLFFLLTSSLLSAQFVKGTVVDDTGHRISNVNIYLDGTKTGTVSIEDGTFTLNLSTQKYGNLVFQKEDYETFTVGLPDLINKNSKVLLIKTSINEEKKIAPFTSEAYEKYINYFLNAFIGVDQENVKIKNLKSLKFSYDERNRFLTIKASKPLIKLRL